MTEKAHLFVARRILNHGFRLLLGGRRLILEPSDPLRLEGQPLPVAIVIQHQVLACAKQIWLQMNVTHNATSAQK